MSNLTNNIGHIVITVIIIAAVTILAVFNKITGTDAMTIIAAIGGVSVGGAVASSSGGAQAPSSVAVSTSPGTSSLTVGATSLTETHAPATNTSSASTAATP